MAIDKVGWTIRPNPIQHDGKRQQRPRRKLPKNKPLTHDQPSRPDAKGPGGVDELV